MENLFTTFFYILIFLAIYVQVFFLITFLENRKKIIIRTKSHKLKKYGSVTIIVPCWNEEKTIRKTVHSLLNLNYPKNKLKIFIIDDGSTDNTWENILKFKKYNNVFLFKKENGGKHTALNLGLLHLETEYIGCLDADSMVDKDSLIRIMSYFEEDKNTMAVAPSIIVFSPKNIIQRVQNIEYYMSVYLKKMLGFLGGIHVAPGPFTIFKKEVFDKVGNYRHAHNTEDMEIAYRMQKNYLKIEQCNDAFVYTNTPNSVYKLYKQRLRWIYGFINNTIDYKDLLLKKKYGNFSFFTVPSGIISIIAASYLFFRILYEFFNFIYNKVLYYTYAGMNINTNFNFDPFFINTKPLLFTTIVLYSLVIFSVLLGIKMAKNRWNVSLDIIYFFIIYSLIAPFWLLRAIYNTVISKKPSWR